LRIIILTSVNCGIASMVLPELYTNPKINVVKVLLANKTSPNQINELKRKILKTARIGLLGALNGIRLRKWYTYRDVRDIYSICKTHNFQFSETKYLDHPKTIDILNDANADLGVSLGNGYIPKKIFTIPKFGMINIHTEILPGFRGALDIIWPIYEKINETGFTIHEISGKIDKGNILYQKKHSIKFYPTLEETVLNNRNMIGLHIPKAISYVCEHYLNLRAKSIPQDNGKYYTTPTYSQFLRMVKNNDLMYKESQLNRSL